MKNLKKALYLFAGAFVATFSILKIKETIKNKKNKEKPTTSSPNMILKALSKGAFCIVVLSTIIGGVTTIMTETEETLAYWVSESGFVTISGYPTLVDSPIQCRWTESTGRLEIAVSEGNIGLGNSSSEPPTEAVMKSETIADIVEALNLMAIYTFTTDDIRTIDIAEGVTIIDGTEFASRLTNLEEFNAPYFITANTTCIKDLLSYCTNLKIVNLGCADTSNVTNMQGVFYGTRNLLDVDMGTFDCSSVTNYNYFFSATTKLSRFVIPTNFAGNTAISELMDDSGNTYTAIPNVSDTITLTSWWYVEENVLYIVDIPSTTTAYSTLSDRPWHYYTLMTIEDITATENKDTNEYELDYSSGYYNHWIERVEIVNEIAPTSIAGWFDDMKMLNSADIGNLDLSQCTATSLFNGCPYLSEICVPANVTKNFTLPYKITNEYADLYTEYIDSNSSKSTAWEIYWDNYCGTQWVDNEDNCSWNTVGAYWEDDNGNAYGLREYMPKNLDSPTTLCVNYWWATDNDGVLYLYPMNETLDTSYPGFATFSELYIADDIYPSSTKSWFRECTLDELDLSELRTDNVTSTDSMFYDAEIGSINFGDNDYKNVKDAWGMFGHIEISKLDLSKFDTSGWKAVRELFRHATIGELIFGEKCTFEYPHDYSSMFEIFGYSHIPCIDLTYWDTSKWTDGIQMFYNCYATKIIFGEKCTFESATSLQSMFAYSPNLEELDLSMFKTDNCANFNMIAERATSLRKIDMTGTFSTKGLTSRSGGYWFSGCTALKELKFGQECTFENLDSNSRMNEFLYGLTSLETVTFENLCLPDNLDISFFFNSCTSLKTVIIDGSTIKPKSVQKMFVGCTSLEYVDIHTLDLSLITTSDGTDLSVFADCTNLTTVLTPSNIGDYSDVLGLPLTDGYSWIDDDSDVYTTLPIGHTTSETLIKVYNITSITPSVTSLTQMVGQQDTVTATILTENAYKDRVRYVSSDTSVATVTSDGVVTAVGDGTATITIDANEGSGVKAVITVNVSTCVYSVPDEMEIGQEATITVKTHKNNTVKTGLYISNLTITNTASGVTYYPDTVVVNGQEIAVNRIGGTLIDEKLYRGTGTITIRILPLDNAKAGDYVGSATFTVKY